MSKADKMFEELGYRKEEYNLYENVPIIAYNDEVCYKHIYFNVNKKFYSVSCMNENFEKVSQAINEKCKELGWLENSINPNIKKEVYGVIIKNRYEDKYMRKGMGWGKPRKNLG